MAYNIISTDEMDILLDRCINYLLLKFRSEQAAKHLLSGVSEIYDQLEINPYIFKISNDPFMKTLGYHEAKISGMDYMIIYKVANDNVYVLGIFHTLENYANKMRFLWDYNKK